MAGWTSKKKSEFSHFQAQREKIQVSHIVNRLQKCIEGEVELSPQQIQAANILLRKTLPDLQATDATVDNNHSGAVTVVWGGKQE
jgi:hypothetical protein